MFTARSLAASLCMAFAATTSAFVAPALATNQGQDVRVAQNDAAEKGLRELLRTQPDNATVLNNLGYFLLEHTARSQEALKLIEQAIAIDPVNGSFLDSLGWAHYKLGNLDKARESLEKATVYSRRSVTAHEHLGDVLQKQGRLAEAKRQWEKALEHSIEADEIARLKVKLKDVR